MSGRENAFDKLVNLFLCKVVDEQQNPTNLKFFWKGRAYDNDFELQDRLQLLYQQGMRQFLNEDVTYINKEQIDEAFRFLEKDNDPDATKATIHKFFIQLKFFTNNEFAFIDVHNERLFQENAVVLRSIVEMLQDIKLKSENSDNQFLGDMFEGFLDSGVKQSEGQFFTPMPIVKFIINSLPLKDIIVNNDEPPKAIDYACGAGHFLTELARQIKPLVEEFKKVNINEYYSNITGIEKEYRLSKVAKVSAFMYGQDEIQIVYDDALAKNEAIKNGTYNILVANPPYSVKGFLETLTVPERKSFELFGGIDEKGVLTNNSIETFFIERAKQLLAPDGVAAIILPSSVLSNDANQYRHTREILLQYFHIIAVAELGSGTFGKTGTNTVTLFLRRRKTNPSEAEHFKYRAQSWIDGDVSARTKKNKQYNDLHLLESYCKHISIAFDDYKYFLREGKPNETLAVTDIWKEYEKAFYESTEIKNHQKKPYFKSLKEEQKKADLDELLYRQVRHLETEKLYYFLLAQSNPVPVLVIKSPADNKAMKKFLGYEWSAAKGNEGIKYINSHPVAKEDDEPVLITAQLNAIQTPLYNPSKKDDSQKLNYYINKNFAGENFMMPDELAPFAHTVNLESMLDFGRKDFSKAISLSVKKDVSSVKSKYPLERIENLLMKVNGYQTKIQESEILEEGSYPVVTQEIGKLISGYTNNSKVINDVPVILFGDHNCTFKYVDFDFVRGADGTQILKPNETLLAKYFFYAIQTVEIPNSEKYERHYKYLSKLFIPVPPIGIQQSIVAECQKVDAAVSEANESIEIAKKEIERIVSIDLNNSSDYLKNLVSQISDIVDPNKEKGEVIYIGLENIEKNTGKLTGTIDNDYSNIKSAKNKFREGDILYGKLRPNLNKVYLAESDGICSTDILVLRPNKNHAKLLVYYMLSDTFKEKAVETIAGLRMPRTSWEKIKNIKIPIYDNAKKLISEIEILEAQISTAENIIQEAPAKKQQILKKWLE